MSGEKVMKDTSKGPARLPTLTVVCFLPPVPVGEVGTSDVRSEDPRSTIGVTGGIWW